MNRTMLMALLASLMLTGCGPESYTGIALRIYFPPTPDSSDSIRSETSPGAGQIPPGITSFRICVSAPDKDTADCKNFSVNDYERKKKARIDGLSVGPNRKVTFQGFDINDVNLTVQWCGEVSGVEIKKDNTTRVSMFITACRDFSTTRGPMNSPRVFHTATKLYDGRVLLVGGFSTVGAREEGCIPPNGACQRLTATGTVDIFNPATGEFEVDPGFGLIHPRGLHTATLLPNGWVLITGGCQNAIIQVNYPSGPGTPIKVDGPGGWGNAGLIAELINPDGRYSEEVFGALPTKRANHSAVLLPSGNVALFGGFSEQSNSLGSAALYQAISNDFIDIPFLKTPRQGMAVVPYGGAQDRYLVWGGNHPPSAGAGVFAEIIEVNGDDIQTREPPFVMASAGRGLPAFHASGTELSTGDVLVTGGMVVDTTYDQAGSETIAGPIVETANMGHSFAFHTTTLLRKKNVLSDPDYKVMLAGGFKPSLLADLAFEPQGQVIFYVPWEQNEAQAFSSETAKFLPVSLSLSRAGHTATTLNDTTVLLAGGLTGTPELAIAASAEVYNPDQRVLRPW
jgi:hypothetical protein